MSTFSLGSLKTVQEVLKRVRLYCEASLTRTAEAWIERQSKIGSYEGLGGFQIDRKT